jgi:hypothetical protein
LAPAPVRAPELESACRSVAELSCRVNESPRLYGRGLVSSIRATDTFDAWKSGKLPACKARDVTQPFALRLPAPRGSVMLGALAGSTLSAEMGRAHRSLRFDNST